MTGGDRVRVSLVLTTVLVAFACGSHTAVRPRAIPPSPPVVAVAKPPPAPAPPPVRRLEADTPMKSPTGMTFEAPRGWSVVEQGGIFVLEDPEHDLTLALLEVPNEPDAAKAIEGGWQRVKPGFALKVKQRLSPPVTDGWDAITQLQYDTGGAEPRTAVGVAQRKGTTQYLALFEGANAGVDRRGAQLGTIISTVKVPGVAEESLGGRAAHPFDAERAALLDAFMSDAMTRAEVPGAAIVVVQGGKVVHEQGFGVRELGKAAKVTPSTLFLIGSTTKSLTTLMMAKLVDEGKFGWESAVSGVLPSFALGDAAVTAQVRIKHTVCACTGLPRQDMEFLFEYAKVTPEERVASMKDMRPTTGFGETFQYSNTMVATGGFVAAHAAEPKRALGPAYDAVMQSRVFTPLGMSSTTLDFARAKEREHASPHMQDVHLKFQVLPLLDEEGVVPVRPAGGAWSNVRDMSRYVLLELAKGRNRDGKSVVSEANLLARREPQVKITDKLSYGLGLLVENDHGVRIVHHGGNNVGFTSDMFFLPEHDTGVVLLTNAGGANAFRKALRRRVLELLFDGKDEARKVLDYGLTRKRNVVAVELAKVNAEPDPAWTSAVTGTYRNANLGVVTLRAEGATLTFDAGEWKSPFAMKRETDGTTKVVILGPPVSSLELLPGERDGKRTLTLEAAQQKYEFEKVGPSGDSSGQ